MNEVERVPKEVSGVNDGVQLDALCVHTVFEGEGFAQQTTECALMASWENGIMSINFTVNGKHQSVGVRLDEVLALLQAANEARAETK